MPPSKSSTTVKQRSYRVEERDQSDEPRKATTARRPVTKRRTTAATKSAVAKSSSTRNGSAKQSSSKASYTLAGVKRASILLKQVSDATRLQILLLLSDAEHNVGAICNELGGQSQPAVSHHLAKLRDGRLIEPRREGKNNVYMLTEEGRLLAHTVKSLTWLKA